MPEQNLIYLFAAYTIIWIVLFGYMFFLAQQVGDLRSQLAALRRQRENAAPHPPDRDPNG
ncbi:MAG: CcmD family protein [Chloroflexota bacterium]